MNRTEASDQVAGPPTTLPGEALDLRAYVRPILRWKWLVLAIAVLAAGGTYAITSREHKTYAATTRVYVQDADPAASVAGPPPSGPPTAQSLQDVATLFTGQAITTAVYRRLGLPVGSVGPVVVAPEATSSFVDVTASSRVPALAARLANTYVTVFLASQEASVATAARAYASAARATLRTIPQAGASNLTQRSALLAQIDQYDTIARNPSAGSQPVDPAVIPTTPSSPRPTRDAIFAGVIGLLVAIALAYTMDLLDRRLVRVSSVQSLLGLPVVAVLPHVSKTAPRANGAPATPPAFVEVMRGLRVNLRLTGGGRPPKSVLITSGLPSEGKSTVARDLAFAYADAGERVLLLDCDLRRPSLARLFDVEPESGLVQVLRREVSPAQAAVTVFRMNAASANGSGGPALAPGDPRVDGSISLITHGERVESPAALLSSTAMKGLLAAATSVYDIVILDTSPVLTVSDAIPLLDQVGAVLFIARLGITTREAAARLSEIGERVPGMNLVGVVVNDMRDKFLDEGYGSYSQYMYRHSHANG